MNTEELEIRLATTLSPMLLTISVFSLGALAAVSDPSATFVDELLALFAAFSVFAAAVLADFVLDKQSLRFRERLTYLGGGYLCFAIVVSTMTSPLPIFYEAKRVGLSPLPFERAFVPGIAAGFCVFGKLMSHRDHNGWLIAMLVTSSFTIYALWR